MRTPQELFEHLSSYTAWRLDSNVGKRLFAKNSKRLFGGRVRVGEFLLGWGKRNVSIKLYHSENPKVCVGLVQKTGHKYDLVVYHDPKKWLTPHQDRCEYVVTVLTREMALEALQEWLKG
jgi:hypothetical protein